MNIKITLVSILYILNKYVNLSNIIYLFLLLSPFFIGSHFPIINAIKLNTAVSFSILIITFLLIKQAININFKLKINIYFIIILLFFILATITVILTYRKYPQNLILFGAPSTFRLKNEIIVILTLFCCYQTITSKKLLVLIKVFYYSYFLSLLGIIWNIIAFKKFGFEQMTGGILRLTSFMHDPNIYGLYLVQIIILSYLFFLKTPTSYFTRRLKYIVIGISALLVLFFTISRGSYLILFILILILFKLVKTKLNKRLITIISLVLFILFTPQILKRMGSEVSVSYFNSSDYLRISTNMAAVNMIKDNFIKGVGYHNSRYLIKKYQHKNFPFLYHLVAVHNIYITIFAELGIIGFSLLMLFTILLLKESYGLVKLFDFPKNILFIFNFCVIVTYIFHGLIYHHYFERHLYWFLTMICLLSFKYKDEIVEKMESYSL